MRIIYIIIFVICNLCLFAQKQINPNIFGFRMSTSFVFFDVEDSVFTNKVIDISPRLLCFPGGFGNFYHLNGPAYGINLKEVSNYNKVKAEIGKSLNWIGRKKGHSSNYIYDFISLVSQTKSEVIFNINILNEPVEDYLRVLEIFEENNINVIAVELGGELYTREYKDIIDGELYIKLAKNCADNINKYYPNVLIGVVAAPVNTLRRHNFWNRKLALESFYDAIIVHSYAKVTKGDSHAGKMISEDQEFDDKKIVFDLYRQRVINYFKNDYPSKMLEYSVAFENKPIWITEWNLQMSKITANTMLQALYTASYLLELSTNSKLSNIELATFHNMAGRTLSGSMLLKKDNNMHVLSTYVPMLMLGELFLDDEYLGEKISLSDKCIKYIFTQHSSDKKIIYWVNWSEDNFLDSQILNGKYIKKEYYAKDLFSTSFDKSGLNYFETDQIFNNERVNIMPYSFTMIIFNE